MNLRQHWCFKTTKTQLLLPIYGDPLHCTIARDGEVLTSPCSICRIIGHEMSTCSSIEKIDVKLEHGQALLLLQQKTVSDCIHAPPITSIKRAWKAQSKFLAIHSPIRPIHKTFFNANLAIRGDSRCVMNKTVSIATSSAFNERD